MQQYSIEWIKSELGKGHSFKYLPFWGHTPKSGERIGKFIFSQWYVAPFVVDGLVFNTAEHWMMFQKALLFDDREVAEKIIAAKKPGEAKELGREVRDFNDELWNAHRFDIVVKGSLYKFGQHPELAQYLMGTGDRILVEASPVDRIWGVGLAADKPQIENPFAWKGLNLLGFALMETRKVLQGQ